MWGKKCIFFVFVKKGFLDKTNYFQEFVDKRFLSILIELFMVLLCIREIFDKPRKVDNIYNDVSLMVLMWFYILSYITIILYYIIPKNML